MFARVSHATKPLHEQMHTMLDDTSQGTIRISANDMGNDEEVIPVPSQSGSTCTEWQQLIASYGWQVSQASEAVHSFNLLEGGGCKIGCRSAKIPLVPARGKGIEGPVTMVLCSTDMRHAR